MSDAKSVSLVMPACNEEAIVGETIREAKKVFEAEALDYEIIVVDDGSTDGTAGRARAEGVVVVGHPENLGYGAALKSGIKAATKEWVAIVDADGTYPIESFRDLLAEIPDFDMVVGARTGNYYRGGLLKRMGRLFFKWLSEFTTGRRIPDINSGMRVFRRDFVLAQYRHISTGFSFTTTLTLSMMLEGRFVKYVPISYRRRTGQSRVRYWRDSLRAAQIVVQAILWYNPVKIFLLLSAMALLMSLLAGFLIVRLDRFLIEIFILWAGCMSGLLLFAMGGIGYIIRSSWGDRGNPSS